MSQHTPTLKLDSSAFKNAKIAIVQAQWNGHITSRLTEGALSTLSANGVPDEAVDVYEVPGAVELTFAAGRLVKAGGVDAIIVFGCVIRGDTPHFDYVCESVTQGVTQLNSAGATPVIFGLLTVENEQQALDRVGGCCGHKGCEAAEAALQMISFARKVQ